MVGAVKRIRRRFRRFAGNPTNREVTRVHYAAIGASEVILKETASDRAAEVWNPQAGCALLLTRRRVPILDKQGTSRKAECVRSVPSHMMPRTVGWCCGDCEPLLDDGTAGESRLVLALPHCTRHQQDRPMRTTHDLARHAVERSLLHVLTAGFPLQSRRYCSPQRSRGSHRGGAWIWKVARTALAGHRNLGNP